MNGQTGWQPTVLLIAIVVPVIAIRWWRAKRLRRLRLETLWIMPAIFTAVVAMVFTSLPPAGWGWALCIAAAAIGSALGWQRGRLMRIEVDPVTHALNHRPSPAALLFIVALLPVRTLLKQAMAHGGATMLHLNAATVTDAFVALGWGLIVAQRVEMFLRAKRLLRAAKAA